MKRTIALTLGFAIATMSGCASHPKAAQAQAGSWRDTSNVDKSRLGPTGRGRFWVLEPGHTATYRGEGGSTLVVRSLDETRLVDGVTTRVVEEREENKRGPIEIARNYLAIDNDTGDIYYFGEDAVTYKDGQPSGDGGSWLSGVNGARFGLLVPGGARLGDRFQQENAPGIAMDCAEIRGLDEKVRLGAVMFEHCLHVVETTSLDKDVTHKWYAPGVGLIKDDEFELVSVTEK